MFGKGMVNTPAIPTVKDVNEHKALAGAGTKGNFGVKPFHTEAVRCCSGRKSTRGDGYRREPMA